MPLLRLTSGGVVMGIFGDLRSRVGFDTTDLGDRSIESRELCEGNCASDSDLAFPLLILLGVILILLALGVVDFLGVSEIEDLLNFKFWQLKLHNKNLKHNT